MKTTEERLLDHCEPEPNSGCWLWTASCYNGGYGQIKVDGKTKIAHRVAYETWVGEIPEGLCVCHKCDIPGCIRPDHLFIGTQKDNVHDCMKKERFATGDNHYSRLHPEKLARGDKNGSRLHPEKMSRGDNHYSRLHPEKLARGDKHYSQTHPEKLARGEKHGRAKLTIKKVLEIRSRIGERQIDLAVEFGVGKTTIGKILNRKKWAHI